MAIDTIPNEADEQDQSETFDETNSALDEEGAGAERRTFEELPEVLDVTRAEGDEDDDEALIGEDLDDEEIIELEADSDAEDLEDDGEAGRDGIALQADGTATEGFADALLDEERGIDAADRHKSRAQRDEPPLAYAGSLERIDAQDGDASVLEADTLTDDDIESLGYDGGERTAESAGAPVRFEIAVKNGLWTATRDGEKVHDYGHADRAVREVSAIARQLRGTGQRAEVYFQAADGKTIQITDDAPPPTPPTEEHSAVVPDRPGSA